MAYHARCPAVGGCGVVSETGCFTGGWEAVQLSGVSGVRVSVGKPSEARFGSSTAYWWNVLTDQAAGNGVDD